MKKTLFALLACASLTAPAMAAHYWLWPTDLYTNAAYGADGTTLDTNASHYSLYLIVPSDEYASVATLKTTLSSGTLNDFTKFLTNNCTSTSPHNVQYNKGGICNSSDDVTNIDNSISPSKIFAAWVYNNGETGDKQVVDFNIVATQYGDTEYYLASSTSKNTNSGWTSFSKTPEPATATLSLLALAGLASRRRRH